MNDKELLRGISRIDVESVDFWDKWFELWEIANNVRTK
jgi:hypothetical protein